MSNRGNGHAIAAFGVQYQSVRAMCADHGVSYRRVRRRLSAGLTPERAIEESSEIIKDHKGVIYPTRCDMARAWGIAYSKYLYRLRHGWSVEEALEGKGGARKCVDHTGKVYRNMTEMAKAWGINATTLSARLRVMHWPTERALTETPISCMVGRDHKGNTYKSFNAMCKAYGIPAATVATRLENGWVIEAALTTPATPRRHVLAELTPEELAHSEQIGLLRSAVAQRLRAGWSKERAINTPPIPAGSLRRSNVYTDEEAEILKASGVSRNLFLYRLRKNWSRDSAMRLPPGAGYVSLFGRRGRRRKKAVNNTAENT